MSTRSVGWHAIVTLAGQWAKYLVQIVALVVFSRLLDPHEFGVVAMVTAIVGVAYVVGDLGLSLAAVQAPRLSDGQRSNLFWLTALIGCVIGGVIAASGPALAAMYGDDRVRPVAWALAWVFVANGIAGQFRTELIRARRFERIAVADVVGQVLGLAAGLGVVVLLDGGLWGLVVQLVAAAVVTMVVLAACSGWWPGLPRRHQQMGGLLRFGSFSLAASVVQYLSVNIDQVIIGRSWGAATVGLYNRAFQVARVPAQQVAAPLTRVVLPHLVERLADPVRFLRALRRIQGTLGAALIVLFAYLIAVAPEALRIALGPGWDEAVPFVRVLCLAGMVEAISRAFYWAFLAHGRVGTVFGAELVVRSAMVGLMVLAVGHGAVWVAWAGVAGQVMLLLANVGYVAPKVALPTWPLLTVSFTVMAILTPATVLTMLAGPRLDDWPVVVAFAALTALWLALCSPALLVGAVRAHVVDALRYGRGVRQAIA